MTGFDIALVIDIKEIFMVIIGTLMLTMPHFKKNRFLKNTVSWNGLMAGYLTTFVKVMNCLYNMNDFKYLMKDLALCFRPVLYGLIIYLIFKSQKEENQTDSEEQEHLKIDENVVTEKNAQQEEKVIAAEKTSIDKTLSKELIFRDMGLTKRESQIAVLVVSELTNAEIGEELFIAENTVKKHISNIFEKLGIDNREQMKNLL